MQMQTKQRQLVTGWLFLTASKKEVRFVPHDDDVPEDVPWEIFADNEPLLNRFIDDFSIERESSLVNAFCYPIYVGYDDLYEWVLKNCDVIEFADFDQ